jgi:hypothetical protein
MEGKPFLKEEFFMGLDMWLLEKKNQEEFSEVGYWRKSNQIREYFASYIPEQANENIDELIVTESMIDELENRILSCLLSESTEVAEDLLPTSSGFFFGGTDYDHYYYEDLIDTLEILHHAQERIKQGKEVIYHEWW